MVLHVIDASDPDISEKINVVNTILDQLNIPEEKEVLVFNKADLISQLDRDRIAANVHNAPYIFVSTSTQEGIEELTTSVFPRFLTTT